MIILCLALILILLATKYLKVVSRFTGILRKLIEKFNDFLKFKILTDFKILNLERQVFLKKLKKKLKKSLISCFKKVT